LNPQNSNKRCENDAKSVLDEARLQEMNPYSFLWNYGASNNFKWLIFGKGLGMVTAEMREGVGGEERILNRSESGERIKVLSWELLGYSGYIEEFKGRPDLAVLFFLLNNNIGIYIYIYMCVYMLGNFY